MPTDIPSLWAAKDAPDDVREQALAMQAFLPADLVNPADVLGDETWGSALQEDFLAGGENALANFRSVWEWNMTPQQRADALAGVELQREMGAFIDKAAGMAAKPPVDPESFAATIRETRAERARRI
jgi:hypothetical protein